MKEKHYMTRRKLVEAAGAAIGVLALAGCANSRASQQHAASEESKAGEPTPTESDAGSAKPQAQPEAAGESSLVVVFSWSGNTLKVAERIADDLGCGLFRIEPAEPYTNDYDEMLQIAQDEQAANALPTLAATVPDWDSYTTIYLGFPTWWGHLPQIVKSFTAAHDCADRVVYPFNTHAGSGFANTLSDLKAACQGADIREGLSLMGDSVDGSTQETDAWVQATI